jgi:hypothetical protein
VYAETDNEWLTSFCRKYLQNFYVCMAKILNWREIAPWHGACVHHSFYPNRAFSSHSTWDQKGFSVILAAFNSVLLICALSVTLASVARASPITIAFTAMIGTGNDLDAGNVFNEGYGANLAGQVIVGSLSIDPVSLTERCGAGGACYGDFGAGAVSVSFTLNGITSTVVSTGTLGYFANVSGGLVSIEDPSDGGYNYLAVGAASPDGMMEQSIGVLFNNATRFSAFGGGDPSVAIESLDSIGGGWGLVKGGITLLSPVEHLDATILTIDVPEPGGLVLLGAALVGLGLVRRKMA